MLLVHSLVWFRFISMLLVLSSYDLEYHENLLGQLYGSLFVYFKFYTDAKGEKFTSRQLVKKCVFVYLFIY